MRIVKCESGHFFDGDRYEKCPHCKWKEETTQMSPEECNSKPLNPEITEGSGIPFPPLPQIDPLKILQGDWLSHFVSDEEGCRCLIPFDYARENEYFVSMDLKRKRTLINILKAVKDFSQTKDIYDKYIEKRKSKLFHSMHSRELNLHERAINTLHIESRYLSDADYDLFCEEIDKEIEEIEKKRPRKYSGFV